MRPSEYARLIADRARIEAFRTAIEAVVRPDQVVLDLGTGLGTFAMFAARSGARVIAVDRDPIVELARELAAANGLGDRIEFIRGLSTEVEPPARADVLIFEEFPSNLVYGEVTATLRDARERWLVTGATAIPERASLLVAPVSSQPTYEQIAPSGRSYGLDLERLRLRVLNDTHRVAMQEGDLLAEATTAVEHELLSDRPLSLAFEGEWRASRAGVLHGLLIWMDLDLGPGGVFTNGPAPTSTVWGQVLLPVLEPVEVARGERIAARISTLGPSQWRPDWWAWRVEAGGEVQDMNTFRALPLSLESLRKLTPDFRPAPTPGAELRRTLYELIDGRHTVSEIADRLAREHPELVPTLSHARRAIVEAVASSDGSA